MTEDQWDTYMDATILLDNLLPHQRKLFVLSDNRLKIKGKRAKNKLAADAIRDVIGNPFSSWVLDSTGTTMKTQERLFKKEWLTHDVEMIAAAIRKTGDFRSFHILGDALKEAGCDVPDILEHCEGFEVVETVVYNHCPKCVRYCYYRRGVNFDHLKMCGSCGLTWEPGKNLQFRRNLTHESECWLLRLLTS